MRPVVKWPNCSLSSCRAPTVAVSDDTGVATASAYAAAL